MESIFLLAEGERSAYLQQLMQSFDCDYICLWSYIPQPSRCLLALDGSYRERRIRASSSAGSLAKQLFDVYRESVNYIDNGYGRIPGMAFKNRLPYMELKLHDLQRLAFNQVQLQFYQEAGIKTAVFMGCAVGEIELGMSIIPPVDLETEMKNLFPIDFSRDPKTDPNQRPSSSSSSLRSLSVESPPEYCPLLFNINPTTTATAFTQEQTLKDQTLNINTTTSQQSLGRIRNIQLPTKEKEDDAMIKAILAVLSNQSPIQQQNLPPNMITHGDSNNPTSSAFKRYIGGAAAINPTRQRNMLKRAVLFFRNLMNVRTRQEMQMINQTGSRPSATQLHHMISERRRREKLNESFQILRSLLPPGSKKDKASVLSNTTEYLSALKSQVAELSQRNQMLESQIQRLEAASGYQRVSSYPSSVETTNRVEITPVSSSTSEARFLDVRVSVVRSGERSMLDLVIRIMELVKQQPRDVSLLSLESNTRIIESIPRVHEIMLRLRIEGHEFDESGFQEAVRRVVDDG